MKIGLHDSEKEYLKNKSFPNYALMKISARRTKMKIDRSYETVLIFKE